MVSGQVPAMGCAQGRGISITVGWIPLVLVRDRLGAPGARGGAQWVIPELEVGWGGEGSLKFEEWLSSVQ